MAVISFTHGKASAKLIFIERGVYNLTNVWTDTQDRNKGYAKGVMQKVISYADEHQLTIRLQAQRYGKVTDPALDNSDLEAFYSKFGFKTTDRAPIRMIRLPSQKIHAP